MGRKIDLTGQRFGRLVVLRAEDERHPSGSVVWLCACDCGKTKAITSACLRSHGTQSCGCLSIERTIQAHRKNPGTSGLNRLLRTYKRHAKGRGLSWNLSADDFQKLTKRVCMYCGTPPNQIVADSATAKRPRTPEALEHAAYTYNGIDRIDNRGGYTIDNCVTCCGTCNRVKSDHSVDELFSHLEKMLNHYNKTVAKK